MNGYIKYRPNGRSESRVSNRKRKHNLTNLESKFCCSFVMILSTLEIKRLLFLAFEMLTNLSAINFVGILRLFIIAFVAVGLGFPISLIAFFAIRKYTSQSRSNWCKFTSAYSWNLTLRHQYKPCSPNSKCCMRNVAIALIVCAGLNAANLAMMGFDIHINKVQLQQMFITKMESYASNLRQKTDVDDLQMSLQCCGPGAYSDWFDVDWQVFRRNNF